MGGAILTSSKFKEETLKPFLRHTGPCISPFNAWVLLKSLETIELRVNKQSDQALEIAKILESNSNVEKVNYPFLNSFNQFDLAQKQMRKGSNMISFTIKGTKENAYNVINKLKLFDISNNLGDTKSLVTHPATTTHRILPEDERLSLGITDKLIRLSIGLENIEDIKNDLDLALKY
jgi:O-succinylhomoserine sulfhydrylase